MYDRMQRDIDFYETCERIRQEHNDNGSYISVSNIAVLAVNQPARAFYISEGRCSDIIQLIHNRQGARSLVPVKEQMYREIEKRYKVLHAEYPTLNCTDLARVIIEQPAPRFYISEARAVSLYYELLSKPMEKYKFQYS